MNTVNLFLRNRSRFAGLLAAALLLAPFLRAFDYYDLSVENETTSGWITLDHDVWAHGVVRVGDWEHDLEPYPPGFEMLYDSGNATAIFRNGSDEGNFAWETDGVEWWDPSPRPMQLDFNGNLTLVEPSSGNTIIIIPGNGTILNPGGTLTFAGTLPEGFTFSLELGQMAIGYSVTVGTGYGAIALGYGGFANGEGAQSSGYYNWVSGNHAVGLGGNNTSGGFGTVALGSYNTAYGIGSLAQGRFNTANANAAVALGVNNTVTGAGSAALGSNLTVAAPNALVAGQWANITGNSSIIFALGNGTGSGNQSTAFTVLNNGNTTIAGAATVQGAATMNSTLYVGGNATFNGTANVSGNTVLGNLTVGGDTVFSGNVKLSAAQGDIPMGPYGE